MYFCISLSSNFVQVCDSRGGFVWVNKDQWGILSDGGGFCLRGVLFTVTDWGYFVCEEEDFVHCYRLGGFSAGVGGGGWGGSRFGLGDFFWLPTATDYFNEISRQAGFLEEIWK